MRREINRRRRRLVSTVTLVVAVLVSALAFAENGRRRADAASVQTSATDALRTAHRTSATSWAAEELRAAENLLSDGNAEHRRQLARWSLPDFTEAERYWLAARSEAAGAAELGDQRLEAARRHADALLATAESTVSESAGLAARIHLGSERRALLGQARVVLAEARIYRREDDYLRAATSASLAADFAGRVKDHAAQVAARYADEDVLKVWQQWKDETVRWSRQHGRPAILVAKEEHRVTLYINGRPSKVYKADMGFNWVSDKRVAGDGATPEGRYRVVTRKSGRATAFDKALLLDYPNGEDRERFRHDARSGSLPDDAQIGGLIEIHGDGGRGIDWTSGCVALAKADMDDLFGRVDVGTPVTILGSDRPGALAALADGRSGESAP